MVRKHELYACMKHMFLFVRQGNLSIKWRRPH